jgi:hypothetical protein
MALAAIDRTDPLNELGCETIAPGSNYVRAAGRHFGKNRWGRENDERSARFRAAGVRADGP